LIHQNTTWGEFTLHKNKYTGKIPRAFDMVDDEIYLTPIEIAEVLEVSEETVRRWCRQGKLKVVSPTGRYKILGTDLKEFLYQWWRKDLIK
jgi:excisionase family DNA binding protein